MIDEFQSYYGIILYSLFRNNLSSLTIKSVVNYKNGFIINSNKGLILKHSTARLSPWNFSFGDSDKSLIADFKNEAMDYIVAFACGFSGVCVIHQKELKILIGEGFSPSSRVTIRTVNRGSWDVSGNAAKLRRMKPKSDPWIDCNFGEKGINI